MGATLGSGGEECREKEGAETGWERLAVGKSWQPSRVLSHAQHPRSHKAPRCPCLAPPPAPLRCSPGAQTLLAQSRLSPAAAARTTRAWDKGLLSGEGAKPAHSGPG